MIVYSRDYLNHDMDGHPENKARLIAIIDFLEKIRVFEKVPLTEPTKASEKDILRVHTKEHLENMRLTAKQGLRVEGDTYFTRETYDTALLAAGGVLTCLNVNQKKGFALVRPPGHHATTSAAMGFCIFNNAAIGAAYARTKGFRRIAILDFDLHHGNGTQEIFYNDDILYISLHQWPHYPGTGSIEELGIGRGEGYTINIPLPGGVGDESYNLALNEIVFPLLREYSPEVLFLSAGYDGHFNDPLGSLNLSSGTYLNIAKVAKTLAKKVVFSLEGGYDLEALPLCVYASLQGLFDLEDATYDAVQMEDKKVSEHMELKIKKIRDSASRYWAI
jgi:acetoin utilization deacetylase AcuC-like enzyme